MLVATSSMLYRLSDSVEPELVLEGVRVARVAEGSRVDVVASRDGDVCVLRRSPGDWTSTGIEEPITSLLIVDEAQPAVLIGTEAPQLYLLSRSTTTRNASFASLPCRPSWHTPWGGPAALRSLAAAGDSVYADIHVGSIMRSCDKGRTWEPVTPDLHEDVHEVGTCPAAPERVYATTARAVYISDDRGQSWQHRAEDLGARYGRAVAVAHGDPELILTSVSDGPHGDDVHGQLYVSHDAGLSWAHVCEGFPGSTKANIDTFHVTFTPDGLAWATVGRTLYVGEDRATRWRQAWEAPEPILMLASRKEGRHAADE
jgi:photosystem II stability/assembly factor-like uncharacterized protein